MLLPQMQFGGGGGGGSVDQGLPSKFSEMCSISHWNAKIQSTFCYPSENPIPDTGNHTEHFDIPA
jgi:hypothetical protein